MASQHGRKQESVKTDFAASRTTRTPDRVSQNDKEGRPVTAHATTTPLSKRDSHVEKEKRPSTAADNTRTSVGKQDLNTNEDTKGLKTFCEERNYKEECQLHSNIEPQDAEEHVLKRNQEHNTKREMKELENLCKDLKEKDAEELKQPPSTVDPQDVDEHVLRRNILLEESNAEVKKYEEETERLTQENTQLRMSINSLIEEKECLIEERTRLSKDKQSLIEEAKREREQSTNELENLRKDLNKSHEKELAQLLQNIDRLNVEKDNSLKREREQSTKELENLRRDLTKCHEKELAQLLQNIDRLNVEKDNLLKRLSTIASDRLTHENPNIADLSDENRPTKLQEVYGELYDNEWTDAFEELKTHMNISEKDAIMILLKIIMNSFHNCREITWSRYEKLVNVASSIYIEKKTPIRCTEKTSAHDIKKPAEVNMTATSTASVNSCNEMEVPKHNETSVDQKNRDEKMESRTEKIGLTSAKSVQSSKDKKNIEKKEIFEDAKKGKENKETSEDAMAKCSIELNVGIMHAIKNIWKTTSFELKVISAESIFSVVATNLDIPLKSMPNTSKYLKSCVDLCWRMSVQEMPLHLEAIDEIDVKAQKKFDKDKFRHFTKSGEKVDYVVWPALYRYEGGPLILKGIAQGC